MFWDNTKWSIRPFTHSHLINLLGTSNIKVSLVEKITKNCEFFF